MSWGIDGHSPWHARQRWWGCHWGSNRESLRDGTAGDGRISCGADRWCGFLSCRLLSHLEERPGDDRRSCNDCTCHDVRDAGN